MLARHGADANSRWPPPVGRGVLLHALQQGLDSGLASGFRHRAIDTRPGSTPPRESDERDHWDVRESRQRAQQRQEPTGHCECSEAERNRGGSGYAIESSPQQRRIAAQLVLCSPTKPSPSISAITSCPRRAGICRLCHELDVADAAGHHVDQGKHRVVLVGSEALEAFLDERQQGAAMGLVGDRRRKTPGPSRQVATAPGRRTPSFPLPLVVIAVCLHSLDEEPPRVEVNPCHQAEPVPPMLKTRVGELVAGEGVGALAAQWPRAFSCCRRSWRWGGASQAQAAYWQRRSRRDHHTPQLAARQGLRLSPTCLATPAPRGRVRI